MSAGSGRSKSARTVGDDAEPVPRHGYCPGLTDSGQAAAHRWLSSGGSGAAAATGAWPSISVRGAWHIFSPSHCWPHQHRPVASMMQVPLPQQRWSSVIHNSMKVGVAGFCTARKLQVREGHLAVRQTWRSILEGSPHRLVRRQHCSVRSRSRPSGVLTPTAIKPTFTSAAGATLNVGEQRHSGQSHGQPPCRAANDRSLPTRRALIDPLRYYTCRKLQPRSGHWMMLSLASNVNMPARLSSWAACRQQHYIHGR